MRLPRSVPVITLLILLHLMAAPAVAQRARQAPSSTFSPAELVDSGHNFFGTVSRGLAQVIEEAVRRWGEPNGYVLGQEASGALFGGLRYGEGSLYTRNAGQHPVFWQGPSLGFDIGGDGARTMMLVYNLPEHPCPLPPLRRRRRLGLFRRRLRPHGRDGAGHRGGADPVGGRRKARRQCRLPEIHRRADLEPVLAAPLPGTGSSLQRRGAPVAGNRSMGDR